ncbi:Transcription factor bHLH143 [Platanthera guangdongensis]|uniref:Transcription factor bHLH143 n=1 Tax=Platanthera guangdongensis TaxID=2320717 RepID=A0ABR2MZ13_9ASPA
MWKFSNSNSSCAIWPPDAPPQHKSAPFFHPSHGNSYGCLSVSCSDAFPGFGDPHGRRILHLDSAFTQQLNPLALNPANGSALRIMGAVPANGCLGLGCTAPTTKRFLIFDHSCGRTNLVFPSAGNPQRVVSPAPPPTNETRTGASDCHEEMHEDTEEIDALLYSDSENSFDSEEASTGHSPLGIEEDAEECTSPIPLKRRRLEHSDLTDTASSTVVPCRHFRIADDVAGLSCANSWGKPEENLNYKIACRKRERIQATVNLLRRIVPGGKGKGAAAVLDDAIRYLKSLKIQAEILDGGRACMK